MKIYQHDETGRMLLIEGSGEHLNARWHDVTKSACIDMLSSSNASTMHWIKTYRQTQIDLDKMNPNNCASCEYMRYPHEGGHCYMFRFAPTEVCRQHTTPLLDVLRLTERNLSSLDASHSVAGTFGPWLSEVRNVIKRAAK